MELIESYKQMEEIIEQHSDFVSTESERLRSELSIERSDELAKTIKNLEEEASGRILRIGILGRVKAGKSSLLNAILFNGKSILPKAATPMTAALTVISYGETLSAKVEFYSEEDIASLENAYNKFNELVDKELSEMEKKQREKTVSGQAPLSVEDLRKRAFNKIKRDNFKLASLYEQAEAIKSSGVNFPEKSYEHIKADTLDELAEKLKSYVSVGGKYTSFTKMVHIKINQEKLKDIELVDTPGINDPVISREQRTRDLIKNCDVIFITTPAGQFLSDEDIVLMDRISVKEGLKELYVVASQVDTQLYGSEKDVDLYNALGKVTVSLAGHMKEKLEGQKKTYPEIGDMFDQLIYEADERLILSAGICETISKSIDYPTEFDAGTAHAWENLQKNYPDFFPSDNNEISKNSLDMLSNIKAVHDALERVKNKKDAILEQKRTDVIRAKEKSFLQYKTGLIDIIDEKIRVVEQADVHDLDRKISLLEQKKKTATVDLDETYYELVDELDFRRKVERGTENIFERTEEKNKDDVKEHVEQYQREKSGAVSKVKRFLHIGGYEAASLTYKTVKAGIVKDRFEKLVLKIESEVDSTIRSVLNEWKMKLNKGVAGTLLEKDLDIDVASVKTAVRVAYNMIEIPEFLYSEMPEINESEEKVEKKSIYGIFGIFYGDKKKINHNSFISVWIKDYSGPITGNLREDEAEEFIEAIGNGIRSFQKKLIIDIRSFEKKVKEQLKSANFAEQVLHKLVEETEELRKQVENKKASLESYANIKDKISEV